MSTKKNESFHSRVLRWKFNLFPAYAATGAKIVFIRHDLQEVRIELPCNWRTISPHKAIFGGLIYACVDPVHVMMYKYILGIKKVASWTKNASIDFMRPARTRLYGHFLITNDELETVKSQLHENGRAEQTYTTSMYDAKNNLYARIEYTVHVRSKGGFKIGH